MSYADKSYRVRIRTTVIAEVEVIGRGYDEEGRIRRAVDEAAKKSRRVQLKNARRPIAGGDFEVLTVEPVS